MKRPETLSILLLLAHFAGCGSHETTAVSSQANVESRSNSEASAPVAPQPAKAAIIEKSFAAGDTATLAVPTMTCRMCYKKIQKALTKVEGIGQIELVSQDDADKVNDPRVTLHFGDKVSESQAIAALDEIGYPNAVFSDSESGVQTTK